jgi:hypothetical protein
MDRFSEAEGVSEVGYQPAQASQSEPGWVE